MPGEFEKQIKNMPINETTKNEIIEIINKAGEEFPCLSCTSKDECNNLLVQKMVYRQITTSQKTEHS